MRYISYILFFVILSCKPTQPKDTNSTISKPINTEPQIAFYFLEAFTDSTSNIQIELNKEKIVEGKLKETFPNEISSRNLQNNKWLVTFLDRSNKSIIQLQITNPLVEDIEFVNEEGNLEKKTIYHNKKDFVLRIPYKNSIKFINFEQLVNIDQKINFNFIDQILIK